MKIALSVEEMKHLEELGLDTSNASMYYIVQGPLVTNVPMILPKEYNKIPNDFIQLAYTLQDIIYMLPFWIKEYELIIKKHGFEYYNEDADENVPAPKWWLHSEYDDDLLACGYRMLVWCIENGYIKTNKEKLNENADYTSLSPMCDNDGNTIDMAEFLKKNNK